MPAISNGVNPDTGNMTSVTVAANRRLVMNVSGFHTTYEAGDTVMVPNFEVQYLRRDGIIV